MKKCLNNPIFRIISEVVTNEEVETYVIGGYVRDFLLNRMSSDRDIDIVVVGSGVDIARKIAKKINPKIKVTIFKNFGTAMFRYKNHEIDFVGARKESYRQDSRKPFVEDGTLEDDQKRRDLTINAMAISLNGESYGKFIDPFNGLDDLMDKTIRTPLKPEKTFSDDPLRMMRAIRFATQLKFGITKETLQAISKNKERMKIVSPERIIMELNKIVLSNVPSIGFKLLDKTGILSFILPELHNLKGVEKVSGKQHKDNFYHTLRVLDNVSRKSDDLWLRWAAILHDIAKPRTKKFDTETGWTFHGHDFQGAKMVSEIFRRLRLPLNHRIRFVKKLVRLHLRPISLIHEKVTDSALRRLLFDAGNDIDDLMILCKADITSKNEVRVKQYLKNFKIVGEKLKEIEKKDAIRNFQPPVPGDLIMKTFGLKPCKEVGIIKNAIKEAILDGKIPNKYEPAYRFMLKKGKELGLKPEE
ncbi:MAG: HD domain-containing protein [Bacteroidetes bacterium]|nr:HD domain-containing protein [Bacteroidota bacterium]